MGTNRILTSFKKYMLMNPNFWADNQDEIGEKWEAMKAGL